MPIELYGRGRRTPKGELCCVPTPQNSSAVRPSSSTTWRPIEDESEVVFLAPIDVTIANGRSRRLFDFEYLWEVYKPASKRRWGYYVLPVLFGDRIIWRIEPAFGKEDGCLHIARAWWEPGVDLCEAATPFARGINRLARFLDARSAVIEDVGPPRFMVAVRRRIDSPER